MPHTRCRGKSGSFHRTVLCVFFLLCVWRAWRQPCVMSVEIVSAEAMMQGREEEEEEEFGAPFLDVRL